MTADFSDGSKPGALTLLENLLRQVVLIADFLDLMKLRLDPINVVLFINDYMFEQLPGGVVVSIEAGFYSGLRTVSAACSNPRSFSNCCLTLDPTWILS